MQNTRSLAGVAVRVDAGERGELERANFGPVRRQYFLYEVVTVGNKGGVDMVRAYLWRDSVGYAGGISVDEDILSGFGLRSVQLASKARQRRCTARSRDVELVIMVVQPPAPMEVKPSIVPELGATWDDRHDAGSTAESSAAWESHQ